MNIRINNFPKHPNTHLTQTVNDDGWRRGKETTYNIDLLFFILTVPVRAISESREKHLNK
jgi:hypothetical protein